MPPVERRADAKWASEAPDRGAKANFNPGQLRLPAGQPGGGRWTTGGREAEVLLAGDQDRAVDLRDDENPAEGRHTIQRHVGKSESFLLNRVRTEVYRVGTLTIGLERAGSFISLEAANKLVSSTLAENAILVERVAKGQLRGARLEKEFSSPTGQEAFRRNDRAEPYIRDTTSVRVSITHDPGSPRGYRILTAFPMRKD